MTNRALAPALAVALVGCGVDELDTASTTQGLINDAANGVYVTPGFFFSPPLVDVVTTSGAFDPTLAARLTVDLDEVDCANQGIVGATVHTFPTVQLVAANERYRVTFTDPAALGLIDHACYRIVPRLDGAALGYRDMLVSSTPGEPPAGYKKWGTGTGTKTIAFRVEDMDPDADGVISPIDNCDFDPEPSTALSVPGQIAAYRGDGSAVAAIGGVDGVWTGTETYAAGAVGDAFVLDGASYVVADGFSYAGPWTLQLWARADAIQARNYGLFSSGAFQIDWNVYGGYRFSVGGGSTFNRNFGAASTTAFQHLVVTYNPALAPNIALYRDGVQVQSGNYVPGVGFDLIKIGTNRASKLHYAGAIDDVRVWSRALDASEVAAIYASGAAGVCQ
jgi:hypothetical protein